MSFFDTIETIAEKTIDDKIEYSQAKVVKLYTSNQTFDIELENGEKITDIPLRERAADPNIESNLKKGGLLIYPAEKSTIGILLFQDSQPIIVKYNELERYEIRGAKKAYLNTTDEDEPVCLGTTLNNLLKDMKDTLTSIKDIITGFDSHSHMGNLGSPTSPPTVPWAGDIATLSTNISSLQTILNNKDILSKKTFTS